MKNNQFLTLSHEYQINKTQTLGKGSTGEVYLGKSIATNQPVAIKVIRLQTIDNQVTEYLLKMEKIALQTLVHENVLRGLKIIENTSKCYMITEYCNGGTLKQLIKKQGALSENRSLEIIKGILKGYCCLVGKKIVHRDLKPANIMFHNNVAKIIDFGYCEIEGYQKPSLEYNVGSPSYMAPQSFQNNIYNEKSQIWAIGVILYECLMGKTFDEGKHMSQVFKIIKKYGIPYGKQVSENCRKIISWCLQFKPQKRPSSLQLLQSLSGNKNDDPQFMILEKGRNKINSLFVGSNAFESIQMKKKVSENQNKIVVESKKIQQKISPVQTKRIGKKLSVASEQFSIFDDFGSKTKQNNSNSKQNLGTMTKRTGMMKKVENIQHQLNKPTKIYNNGVHNQYGLIMKPEIKTQKYFSGQNVHNKLHTRQISAFNSVYVSPRGSQKQQNIWCASNMKEETNPQTQRYKKLSVNSGYYSPSQQVVNARLSFNDQYAMTRNRENIVRNDNLKYVARQQPMMIRNSGQLIKHNFREDMGSFSVYESAPIYVNRERPSSSIYQLNQYLNQKQRPVSIFNSIPQRTFR